MHEQNLELLCIVGDVKPPRLPDASVRFVLAHLQRMADEDDIDIDQFISPPGQPISDVDLAKIKAAIDRLDREDDDEGDDDARNMD